MGFDKLFAIIAGRPVIAHAINAFEQANSVAEIIVVAGEDRHDEIRKLSRNESFKKVRSIITGGERRQDSVRAGLENLSRDARYVAIHDAARPLVRPEQIVRVFERCRVHGAAALAEPISDTLKRADIDRMVTASVDRHQLYAMQTPQIFERAMIEAAYRAVPANGVSVTDEVSALERLGGKVFLVPAEDFNFKITYRQDLALAEFVLKQRMH